MALKDQIALGLSLPHRSPDPIEVAAVRQVAQRAEALGFRDLWVTNNTLDHAGCFDSLTLLTYAAALTTTIRVGVSVLVLPVYNPIHVAHQVATLDYLSGGRAVLGVGLGREQHYAEFQIPRERRVRRFLESVELMKALWTQPRVTYRGQIFQLEDGVMGPKGRIYEFGDRSKLNKVSKRPLTQASLRCKRWWKPSSLQRIPTPLNRC